MLQFVNKHIFIVKEIVMTEEEVRKIKFKMVSHLSMSDSHETTYESIGMPLKITMVSSVRIKNFEPYGKSSNEYYINGKHVGGFKRICERLKDLKF